jgi:hypothetical protein
LLDGQSPLDCLVDPPHVLLTLQLNPPCLDDVKWVRFFAGEDDEAEILGGYGIKKVDRIKTGYTARLINAGLKMHCTSSSVRSRMLYIRCV